MAIEFMKHDDDAPLKVATITLEYQWDVADHPDIVELLVQSLENEGWIVVSIDGESVLVQDAIGRRRRYWWGD